MASNDGTTLKRLQVIITGNTSQLDKALRAAENAAHSSSASIIKDYGKMDDAASKMARNSNKSFDGMQSGLGKVGSMLKKVGAIAAAAISVKAIVDFSKECIELGSDLSEVQNVVDVTFGGMSGQVDNFAKGAIKQFGLSETAAKKYSSTMGAMLKSMGFSTDKAYDMSVSLTGLAGDIASFYNLDSDEAFAKIRAGISGETEPLKQLGINMSVANLEAYAFSQGITKSFNAMSQMEQATLRYNYLLSVTSDAQGDFARTSGSWANQTRILAMNFESLKANIGQGLIAALTPVLKLINAVIERVVELSSKFSAFISVLTGNTDMSNNTAEAASNLVDASNAATDVGDNLTNGVKKAEKAAKRFVLGFDELNKLGSEDNPIIDDTAIEALTGPSTIAGFQNLNDASEKQNTLLAEMDEKLNSLKEKMKPVIERVKELGAAFTSGFKDGLGDNFAGRAQNIVDNVKSIGASVHDIFSDPKVQESANNFANKTSEALGRISGAATSIGTSVGQNLSGGVAKYLDRDKSRIQDTISKWFEVTGDTEEKIGKYASSVAKIFEPVGEEVGQELSSHIFGAVSRASMGIGLLSTKISDDAVNIFTLPIIDNDDELQESLRNLLGTCNDIADTLEDAVGYTVDLANNVYDEHGHPFMLEVAKGLSETLGKINEWWQTYIQPLLDDVAAKIDDLWENHLKGLVSDFGQYAGEIFDILGLLWNYIIVPMMKGFGGEFIRELSTLLEILKMAIAILGDLADVARGCFKVIHGFVTGNWMEVFEGIVLQGMGLFNILVDFIIGIMNIVKNAITFFEGAARNVGIDLHLSEGMENAIKTVEGIKAKYDPNGETFAEKFKFNFQTDEYKAEMDKSMANIDAIADDVKGRSEDVNRENREAFFSGFDALLENHLQKLDSDQTDTEVNLYLDGEKIAEGIAAANRLRDARLNPVVG